MSGTIALPKPLSAYAANPASAAGGGRLPQGLVAPAQARAQAQPARPAAAPPPPGAKGKSPFELLLVQYYRSQVKPGQTRITIPMHEAAQHFNLYPAPANIKAFGDWFNQCDRAGVLGPMEIKLSATASVRKDLPNDANKVRALQAALARRGYAVTPNGVYDGATERAVLAFKKAYGLTEAYRTPDGRPAVNTFADERVQAAILKVS